jgi:hypothetical protein
MKPKRIFAITIFLLLAISLALGAVWAPSNSFIAALSARAQTQGADGTLEAQVGQVDAPTFIHFEMTSEPPVMSAEQLALYEQMEARGPLPHAFPLPVGETAVARTDSAADVRTESIESNAQQIDQPEAPSAPGDFTLFRNVDYGATIKANTSGLTGEPAAANSGPIVFSTGNWWAAISGDGGQSFQFVNPYTMFPASYGGFCCDQITVYDPSRDIFIWSLQYIASAPAGIGHNLFRIAAARPQDALQGNWWYYDFHSADSTEWDYPELCLSNDFVYYTTNRGTYASGSVNNSFIFRFPLSEISTGSGFGYGFLDSVGSGLNNLSWRCAQGGRDTAYFASHNSTAQVRILRWGENTGTLFWDDVNLSAAWPNAVRVCPTPDGRDWCGFDDGRIKTGWVGRGMIGFMWNASAGGGFAVPYVEAVRVRESDRAYIDRPFIWNSTLAFQYPAAGVNARGDVGIVVHNSSTTRYPAFDVGVDDDVSRDLGYGPPGWYIWFIRQGTQGPTGNRWGDYFTVAQFNPNGLAWEATGTTMQGCGGVGCKETRYVLFGRERDLRGVQKYYNPVFNVASPLIVR